MNGDNTFRIPIMTVYSTAFVLATRLSSSEYSVAFDSSIYPFAEVVPYEAI